MEKTAIKGIIWKDGTATLTLTELDRKAIRASIQWAILLNDQGKLELYEYQLESFNKLLEIL